MGRRSTSLLRTSFLVYGFDDHHLTFLYSGEMGATGPCGPCSEVHFDRIGGRNAAHLVNQDDPDVLEIWNNVFIQFNREDDGSLKTLPSKHVDTGMGFERLVSVIQDKRSNYDTDVFAPLFEKIQEITGARPYEGKLGAEDVDGVDTAYRVIADHARTLTFALSDGGVPNNFGRGYVLRRILRRGARYARKKMNVQIGSFFSQLVPVVVEQLGDAFPELHKKGEELKEILDEEEVSFAKTLDRGEKLFGEYVARARVAGKTELHGKDVWRLYDTYGFPVDLTRLMAEETGLDINEPQFEQAQAESKEASKAHGKKDGKEVLKLDVHDLAALEKNADVPKTDDSFKYGKDAVNAEVKAIYYNRSFLKTTSEVPEGAAFGILLDKTPFYAESGGQEYDTGKIMIDEEAEFQVGDVQVFNGYVLHVGHLKYGELKIGSQVLAEYDEDRRWPIRNNHTATHILNFALREILGDHIDQKGSLVAPGKLRFDFSHKAQVSLPELTKVEGISGAWIKKNVGVYSKEVDLKTAQRIPGLRAVFGEAYPDPVRVVSLEFAVDDMEKDIENTRWRGTSVEFCGGTHVARTGFIRDFVITEESGIAKGIRRIVAVTGNEAHEVNRIADELNKTFDLIEKKSGKEKDAALKAFALQLNQADISVLRKAELRDKLAKSRKAFDDENKAREKAAIKVATDELITFYKENPNAAVWVKLLEVGGNARVLQSIATQAKSLGKPIYIFSVDIEEGKVVHVNYVPKTMITKEFDAKIWAGKVAEVLGGKAGGKDELSQGVGVNVDRLQEALSVAEKTFNA
ncbi:hypothetical protein M422DRAFT_76648 [Sphaerobolus stellatus SS14]|uniref:Alanine--tRNA ligase n=1 Tax=Sphaerobolus stellatus (strain SS14) TaxID=990650 RepID=A0A0C9V1D1_SPHS4|nr:hypothetical protein M422DRAFT_76648 [Sphaerobolus stellatus SS14]